MLEFPRWKYLVILLVLALSVIYALPNVFQSDYAVQITGNRGAVLDDVLKSRVVDQLGKAGVQPGSVAIVNDSLMVRLTDADAQTRAADGLREGLGENYTVALNLASNVPAWLQGLGAQPMVLGLDLQGGVHFVLQVDQKAALEKRIDSYVEDVRVTLRDNRIRYTAVDRRPDHSIAVNLAADADPAKAREQLAKVMPTLAVEGTGNRLVVRIPEAELTQIAGSAIEQNIATLRNRVNQLGVAEPIIQRQGNDRIVVQLPGVQDTAAAKRMIGATATLEYRAVVDGNAADALASGRVPPEAKVYKRRDGTPILLNKRVIVTGDQMVAATSAVDQNGQPAVSVTLNNVGGDRMFDFTSQNVGKPMGVVYTERIPQVTLVDGQEVRSFRVMEEVISVANINGVFGKNFQTTGLEKAEADELAKLLRAEIGRASCRERV